MIHFHLWQLFVGLVSMVLSYAPFEVIPRVLERRRFAGIWALETLESVRGRSIDITNRVYTEPDPRTNVARLGLAPYYVKEDPRVHGAGFTATMWGGQGVAYHQVVKESVQNGLWTPNEGRQWIESMEGDVIEHFNDAIEHLDPGPKPVRTDGPTTFQVASLDDHSLTEYRGIIIDSYYDQMLGKLITDCCPWPEGYEPAPKLSTCKELVPLGFWG